MKLLYTFFKDLKLSFNNYYIYIEVIFALIFIAVLLFVVPENFESNQKVYANIDVHGPASSMLKDALDSSGDELVITDSKEEIKQKMTNDRSSIGMYIHSENSNIYFEYILQGYENEKIKNILRTTTESDIAQKLGNYDLNSKTIILDTNNEKLTDRVNMIPVFLVLNSAFMGLFIIAAYIFLDKDEGTIRALAVTPAAVWQYLLSKVGVMMVSGLITGLLVSITLAGTKANYLQLLLLLMATNAFGTTLGLFISSFFNSITEAMGWLYMMIIILSITTVSYYMPSFSPIYIKILPSYPMLFAFRETLFDKGNTTYIYSNVALFAGLSVFLFLLANMRFKKTLTV